MKNFFEDKKIIEIEDILSSRGRVKILRILSELEEINITQISKRAMLNHKNTLMHLKKLVEIGIVKEKRFGKIRIFKLNKEKEITLKIIDLIKTWENIKIWEGRIHK